MLINYSVLSAISFLTLHFVLWKQQRIHLAIVRLYLNNLPKTYFHERNAEMNSCLNKVVFPVSIFEKKKYILLVINSKKCIYQNDCAGLVAGAKEISSLGNDEIKKLLDSVDAFIFDCDGE